MLEAGEFTTIVKLAGFLQDVEAGLNNAGVQAGSDPAALQKSPWLHHAGLAVPGLLTAAGVPAPQAMALGGGLNALAGTAGQAVGRRVGGIVDTRNITMNPSTWGNARKPVGANNFGPKALEHINQAVNSGDFQSLERWGITPAGTTK